jgi:copper(I)-binding protein
MKATGRWAACAAMLGLALALAGCTGGQAGAIEVSGAWVRSSAMMDRAGAAYMVIANAGNQDDTLVAVSSDAAAVVELHESRETNGMMEMAPVEGIAVPARGEAELAPGGLHIMLIDLTRELRPGDEVVLTLTFERAGEITVQAVVRES